MGAMKAEMMRLSEIVIFGNADTIKREFEKVGGLADGGALELLACAIQDSRYLSFPCQCGADYYEQLHRKYAELVEKINK